MFHRNVLLVGAVLWLTACGGPLVGEAILKTDQETYAPGAELTLRIQNESFLQPLGYNLCMSRLERQEEGAWTAVPPPGRVFCQAIEYNLGPGGSGESRRSLDETLAEGTYRYVTNVYWGEERQEVVSNTFSVAYAE
jgi:hypothetical protein